MTSTQHSVSADSSLISDELIGYKQDLYRGLGLVGTFSVSFAQQGVMASTTLLFGYGLTNGGPAVMTWVWILGGILSIFVGMCLAEICSTYPYAGSVYQWSAELSPPELRAKVSYITGWLNFLGNAASAVGYSYGAGQFVAAWYDINAPVPLSQGAQVGIAMALTVFMAWFNTFRIDHQGILNKINFVFSLGSLFCVLVSLSASPTPKQTLAWAFTEIYNDSGFDNFGYVCLTGVLTILFGVAGYEASAHLAEETIQARKVAPWGMVFNIITTWVFGLVYLLILLVNTRDIDEVLNTNYATAAIQVFVDTVGTSGANFLTAMIVVMSIMAGLSNMTITARVGWAMARDGAFPYSDWLKEVHPKTQAPHHMIFLVLMIDLVLLLIPLGSDLAFAAVTSISTIGFQWSYTIPIILRLTSGKGWFKQGYFSLGSWSIPLNIISAVFLAVTSIFLFFPQAAPIDVDNFQWAIPVTPAFGIVGWIYWEYFAKTYFRGPARGEEKLAKQQAIAFTQIPAGDQSPVSAKVSEL